MNHHPKLSIVIPAFNEEHRLPSTLDAISAYLKRRRLMYELLVVDDGSKDRTGDIVRERKDRSIAVLSYGQNRGKGFAVRYGMQRAKGDLLLFSDADLSTPITELDKFLKLADRYDVLIGSRNLPESDIQVKQAWYRKLPGRAFSVMTQLFVLPGIKDTQCGFKLFSRRAARAIFANQRIDGFAFDLELLFIARHLGFRIKEVPIVWRNSGESKVRVIRDSLRMLFSIVLIQGNNLIGRYS